MTFVKHLFAAIAGAVLAFSAPAFAGDKDNASSIADEIGLKVGETVPAIEARGADGTKVKFEELVGENGIVLVFVRSIDWCPFCKNQMVALDEIAPELNAKGYPIVALSYDSPKDQNKFLAKRDLSFKMVSDQESEVIKAFGLLNTEYKEGSRPYGVPHPTIYVISKDGEIKGKLMEQGFRRRPEPEMLVELVNSVAQ